MIGYWRGTMNWPIEASWRCETCGTKVSPMADGYVSAVLGGLLEWGLVHAECRCTTCHTVYMMRDGSLPDNPIVTRPISIIKPEFKDSARKAWESLRKPIDELSVEEWVEFGVPLSAFPVDEELAVA
jgi:hypothetical protein